MLADIGIIGWEDIELTVVSALLANIPILFVGPSGAVKTIASKRLAEALLGDELKWAKYECQHIQMDDIVGYPDITSLKSGQVTFVGLPMSVWNVNAIVLDELTRAPGSTAGKLLELVFTKEIFGLPTPLKYVFATANPPSKEYTVNKLDAALVSRFCVIQVPGFHELSEDQVTDVLEYKHEPKKIAWPEKSNINTRALTLQLRRLLTRHNIHLNGRSVIHLRDLLQQSYAAGTLTSRTPHTLTLLTLSCIPEMSKLCTVSADRSNLTTALLVFFESMAGNKLPSSKDWPAYMSAVLSISSSVSSAEAAVALQKLIVSDVLPLSKKHASDIQSILEIAVPKLVQYYPFKTLMNLPQMLQYLFSVVPDADQ